MASVEFSQRLSAEIVLSPELTTMIGNHPNLALEIVRKRAKEIQEEAQELAKNNGGLSATAIGEATDVLVKVRKVALEALSIKQV